MTLALVLIVVLAFLLLAAIAYAARLQSKADKYKAGVERSVLLAASYANERDDLAARLRRQAETNVQLNDANVTLHRLLAEARGEKPAAIPGQLSLPLPDLPVREDSDAGRFDPFDADSHATMVFLGGPPKPGEVAHVDGTVDDEE